MRYILTELQMLQLSKIVDKEMLWSCHTPGFEAKAITKYSVKTDNAAVCDIINKITSKKK